MSGFPIPARPALSPHARRRWDAARGQHQLVYPEAVMELNETAAAILELCDGRTIEALVTELERRFGVDGIEPEVRAFLSELAGKGLVRDAAP